MILRSLVQIQALVLSPARLSFARPVVKGLFIGRVEKQRICEAAKPHFWWFRCFAFFRFCQNCEAAKPGPCFAAPRFLDFVRIAKQRNHMLVKA